MGDTTTGTGTSGTLIIRDNGSTIEFLISCSNSATHISGGTWSGVVNGVGVSGSFTINGVQTVSLGAWGVGTNQTVSFTMNSTGTSGLGGPTGISAFVSRATVPQAPTILACSNILPTSMQINFFGNGSGGATVDYYLVRYGTSNPPEAGAYVEFTTGTGANPRTGLIPDTTYYTRVYAHNGVGYSAPSATLATTTLPAMHVRVGGVWKYAIPWVKVGGVWKMARPFVKVSGVWKKTK